MTTTILAIFLIVYLGMILGGLPFLQLDRTGVALLGAIALIGVNALSLEDAVASMHLPTLILLFAFMVVSAQMRLGGFYDWITHKLATLPLSPAGLLAVLTFAAAALSAVFSNDIVCLAVAPVLIDACRRRRLDPVPFLLALACASNIGSAATLIGNPQNMLIGQTLRLPFGGYFLEAVLPVGFGLLACWALIVRQTAGRWLDDGAAAAGTHAEETPFDGWQTAKGLIIAAALLLAFLAAPWPREHMALIGAGILLMSRRLHSRKMLGLVDWELLVLFMSLFVVNHALQRTGITADAVAGLAALGVRLDQPGPLFAAAFLLSNIVSNVPAVMLLLPIAHHEMGGLMLALVSTLSGNLLIVGSIANIIVVDAAARRGIAIDWKRHARVGVPITLATLAVCAAYLALRFRFGSA
ncbi:anion transporter [Chromobacterium violaceum]|uniref:Probable membrane anion transport protein n=1 Tax=Chromobacterium violaceum (strain ATCC 12472 / DSM 30191 / JCM 1249 / CCUG 213 / NBRC 12614 / NCIMB 9131 / NCTC 9757 / MK) TaxID=243365 RepID=Q7P149_CHRVO|nr:anion transporter [Chromobacterium violaceum]AAQ58043.1 probable membrane anion transport protein [Chromobacterium violaceum ATCC 12472]SUX40368.1 Inner membrane protein YbiR [Chromobacterium violaceum]